MDASNLGIIVKRPGSREVAATIVPILDDCACAGTCYACSRSYGNQQEAELLTATSSPSSSVASLTRPA